MSDIVLPHNWTARPHQGDFMEAMLAGKKRAVCVWHRRAGKDSAALNFTAFQTQTKIANYWHMLPTAVQGRHVVWDAINPNTGQRVIDQVFPEEIRKGGPGGGINNTEMKIELESGSTWQVVGSDNYDRLVGSNPFGVVFSEYSVADPRAWDFIRPILAENGGWAIFIYTPRGKNHGSDLYQMAKGNPEWFCELLDIEHSAREDGSPVISTDQFQAEIDAGMDYQLALQEFYCSFDAGLFGAYWTEEMKLAQYGSFKWDPRKPVHTFWDIGVRDANSIVFAQEGKGSSINIIDYREGTDKGIEHWIKILRELPYSYGYHVAPHDIKQRDKFTAVSYNEMAQSLADFEFEICPNVSMTQQIDFARSFIPRISFNTDSPDVQRLVDCCTNYRREYNDKLRVFMDRPLHDWASHGASAIKYMSIAWNENYTEMESLQHKVIPALSGGRRRTTKMPRVRK